MIRRANIADAEAIATIHVRSWQTAYAEIFPAEFLANLSVEKRVVAWRAQLADNPGTTFIAEENGLVTGWVSGGLSADADALGESEVQAIYVLPEYWDKGVGGELMQAIEQALPPSPGTTLWVLRDNQRALRFYEKLGYTADGAQEELERGGVKRWKIRLRKHATDPAVA
ncbi:Uncharacterized conserved protein [Janthinobacterium sp. Marseille]|nr:GNAT family N-acetyltransferase [Janthinobacterium sp. Marseille]ABR90784.1 Uncharacterized conserved protein [Janthinobacterium sp. Marseille]